MAHGFEGRRNMIRRNKWSLIITSAVILLPIAAGLILWNDLPDVIAVHFDVNNEPNGWAGKAFTVFGLPLCLLALHWICIIATALDKKNKNNSPKMLALLFWVCPVMGLLVSALTYAYAMGVRLAAGFIVLTAMGLLFIALGNYLPKCQPSHTIGVRIPWTLNDPENWRRTHRVAGWSFCIGGVLLIATAFLESWVSLLFLLAAALAPIVYSGVYHHNHK